MRRPAIQESLDAALAVEDWSHARSLLRAALRRRPDDHWLWTRLAMVIYEQRQYSRALVAAQRAFALQPHCPLVLWDLAGPLQALGRHSEALALYRRIVRTPLERLAHGRCGEGFVRARGLVADSYYRISISLDDVGRRKQALAAFNRHISLRGPGCLSIYRRRDLSVPKPANRPGRVPVA